MSKKISKDDQTRVNNCEYYLRTKQVMENAEVYKNLQVGEVYYIKHKNYKGEEEYISAGWNGEPAKYMVFHKEEGFAFVKRIIASGSLGKEVTCLTTTFNVKDHWLEADPDYVNSILLENEDGYDPLAASKQMTANKNKARRRNKKLEISHETAIDAYSYIKSMKKGDIIYDANTAYGSGIITWQVKKVTTRKTDKTKQATWGYRGGNNTVVYGQTYQDQQHNAEGFNEFIEVTIEAKDKKLPKSRQYVGSTNTLTFHDLMKDRYTKYYNKKPYTVDDV